MAKTADYDLGEYTFPRGWFVVARSSEISRKPFNARYFGEDVVIFRGESGAPVMLEAYCPHMGTHFGKSQTAHLILADRLVEGDSIRCPFHGWKFGPDGKCNEIPYFDGPIPEQACVRSWPVVERYGIVFCWNDPEGLAPDFDVPEYPEWDDPQWVRWQDLYHVGDLSCHPIEIVDNNSDVAHLRYLHGGEVAYYENEIDGHYLIQREGQVPLNEGPTPHQDSYKTEPAGTDQIRAEMTLSTTNAYHGPGLLKAYFIELQAWQLIAHTPIDDGQTRLWECTMKKSRSSVPDENEIAELDELNKGMCYGLMQDGEIWNTKRSAPTVMQLPTDGPFRQSRVWYSQFFNPRDKAQDILAPVQGKHFVKGKAPWPSEAAE